jgi:NADH-quinone oxidoreductase subunit M
VATTGVVLGAAYMLTMYKHVVFGPLKNAANETLADLNLREVIAVAPIVLLIFWIGVYPKPFLARIEPTVEVLLSRLERAGATRYLADRSPAADETERVAAR